MIGWRDGGLAAAVAAHLAVMFGGLGAAAQEQPVSALPCGGDAIARGAAGRIVDDRTFALEDGREVRLAAIEVPPLAGPGEAREAEAAGLREIARQLRVERLTECARAQRVAGVLVGPASG